MTLRLALTPGEPSGIGADILISLVQSGCDHELVAYADPQLLLQRAEQLGLKLILREPAQRHCRWHQVNWQLSPSPLPKLRSPVSLIVPTLPMS